MLILYPHQEDNQVFVRIIKLEKHALHDLEHQFMHSYFVSYKAASRSRLSFEFKLKINRAIVIYLIRKIMF